MPSVWPIATIRELLALADANGSASAVVGSEEEAELFRYSIYGFRRRNDCHHDLTVTIEPTAEGTSVVLRKRQAPIVTIVQDEIGA